MSQKRAAALKGVYGRAPVFIVIHQEKPAGALSLQMIGHALGIHACSSDHFSSSLHHGSVHPGWKQGNSYAFLFIYLYLYLLFFICTILLFLLDLIILNYLHNKQKVQ